MDYEPYRRFLNGWSTTTLAVTLVLAASTLIVALNQLVRQEIDAFATANTDSKQWSLAQLDVELLALQFAISEPGGTRAPLSEVRRRFDVFYSRINTVTSSKQYASFRGTQAAAKGLAKIKAFLLSAARVIDSSDPNLRKSLPKLAEQVSELRPIVRRVSLNTVKIFSEDSDIRRLGVVNLLGLVSMITMGLLAVLLVLLGLLLWLNRQARNKTIEESQMRSRLQAIVSTSLDAIVVADREGRVVDFNGAAEEIFGYSRPEAVGRLMEELIVPRHMAEAHRAGMDRYRRTRDPKVIGKGRIQLEARRKSDELFPIEISISTAESVDGELFVSFIRDISKRVAAEKELVKARDDAVAGERAKADLLAVMSHEMRTPLNGMLGTLELFDREDVRGKQRERLDIIRGSARILLQHVNKVLDISRADAGKIEPAVKEFSISKLLSEALDSQRAFAEHRGNSLTFQIPHNTETTCIGDPELLTQILLNLIGNAIKFTRDGIITVLANRHEHDDQVEFRITDTGPGIPESDRDLIFEDFVTLDSSYSRSATGTGLGLGIVRRLVAAMGGEVGVDAAPGGGSMFWFHLPLPETNPIQKSRDDATVGTAPRQELAVLPSLQVLVVEDNNINRVVVKELLEQEGMQVDEASDGVTGVRLAGENPYDLILMDISMPVLDGVAATEIIRASENPRKRVPIIALTAHALPSDIERFRAAGMQETLVKPISRSALRSVLQDAGRDMFGPDVRQSETPPKKTLPAINQAHLAELITTLGEARLPPLLDELEQEMEQALQMLENHSQSDMPRSDLQSMVHHISGSAAILGAQQLRLELIALEEALRLPREGGDECNVARLRAVWDRTRRELRNSPQGPQHNEAQGAS